MPLENRLPPDLLAVHHETQRQADELRRHPGFAAMSATIDQAARDRLSDAERRELDHAAASYFRNLRSNSR